jgi:hypothetical protein
MSVYEYLMSVLDKAAPDLVVAAVTGFVILLVGQRVAYVWAIRQKRREQNLLAAQEFEKLYGEFFSVWKLWNYYIRDVGATELPGASRWELLNRACTAEASVEATLIGLVSNRDLKEDTIPLLGQFRQTYQRLRESIRDNEALPWDSSNDREYIEFKTSAAKVAALIESGARSASSDADGRVEAWLKVTSNKFEDFWIDKPET